MTEQLSDYSIPELIERLGNLREATREQKKEEKDISAYLKQQELTGVCSKSFKVEIKRRLVTKIDTTAMKQALGDDVVAKFEYQEEQLTLMTLPIE